MNYLLLFKLVIFSWSNLSPFLPYHYCLPWVPRSSEPSRFLVVGGKQPCLQRASGRYLSVLPVRWANLERKTWMNLKIWKIPQPGISLQPAIKLGTRWPQPKNINKVGCGGLFTSNFLLREPSPRYLWHHPTREGGPWETWIASTPAAKQSQGVGSLRQSETKRCACHST